MNPENPQGVFIRLKPICVPLLRETLLTPSTIPNASKLLTDLITQLRAIKAEGNVFTPPLINYIFFPISHILQRNPPSSIPDQILEKIFIVLGILCEDWWWNCELAVWEQVFILCGGVIGGIEGKGKGKQRDDETKEAAVRCLYSLLRARQNDEVTPRSELANERLSILRRNSQKTEFTPMLGQTLNSLLVTAESPSLSLKNASLDVLHLLIDIYLSDPLVPTVLPGVVSTMCKLALGSDTKKGWAHGDVVSNSLKVLESVVVRAIGDEVCAREGAIRTVEDLEDLALYMEQEKSSATTQTPTEPYGTSRTPAWLRGSSSQLHIALNSLTPLVRHPSPDALVALAQFSSSILRSTFSTLPQSQALLLSVLLSLSISDYPRVFSTAHSTLLDLLSTTSKAQFSLLETLMRHTRDNLASLPRLLPAQADAKVEHAAGLIEAVCRLAAGQYNKSDGVGIQSISTELSKLLGPAGGIEKWGWSLLSVLEFIDPPITVTRASAAQLTLENDPAVSEWVPFPEVTLRNVSTRSAYEALERMFRSLGSAAGDSCLFVVEWFTNVGQSGTSSRAVAAMWCACRLLEGVVGVTLSSPDGAMDLHLHPRSKRLENFTRTLARSVAQLWDEQGEIVSTSPSEQEEDSPSQILHVRSINSVEDTLNIIHPSSVKQHKLSSSQPMLHRALSLQVISITAGILQSRFAALFLYTLYPILQSLVSSASFLSSTALAALKFIADSTSYASPANLLLSNFDYALDSVSRRLTRRWLDVDATKVLIVMIRITGNDIVERAGDVVEECFDRLDEYHGYDVLVEGLVAVLGEVVKVVKADEENFCSTGESSRGVGRVQPDRGVFNDFFDWLAKKDASPLPNEKDSVDYGPAPDEAWGSSKRKSVDQEDEGQNTDNRNTEDEEPAPTPTQALTKQIVSRSIYFLTHGSAVIRARILTLLESSVPILPESALLPSIHQAWPFILNRLSDQEGFVVSSVAALVEALSSRMGDFMYQRIWDDVWPRFHNMLEMLSTADSANALTRRGFGAVGTESAYTHSHRLYRSVLKTMTSAMKGVQPHDSSVWQLIMSFRRFLHSKAHEELQECARNLYVAIGENNADAVWLGLRSTAGEISPVMVFLREPKWDIERNVDLIFQRLDRQ